MSQEDKDIYKLVQDGYNEVAESFFKLKDSTFDRLEIFHEFTQLIQNSKKVLDLGCGPGSVSKYFFDHDFQYIGIDISEKQIALASSLYPNKDSQFVVTDMLTFCKEQPENSFDGIIGLFSIFHLPRTIHRQLFVEIKRILSSRAPVLFTAFDSDEEGIEENWLHGNKPMYWSNHSYKWYISLLDNLGFNQVKVFNRKVIFDGNKENQFYLLFTKK